MRRRWSSSYRSGLDEGRPQARASLGLIGNKYTVDWTKYAHVDMKERVQTNVTPERLANLGKRHRRASGRLRPASARRAGDRQSAENDGRGDAAWTGAAPRTWRMPRLLEDGFSVRLVGQDVGRGTFFHRHAVLHDQNTDATATCRCSMC